MEANTHSCHLHQSWIIIIYSIISLLLLDKLTQNLEALNNEGLLYTKDYKRLLAWSFPRSETGEWLGQIVLTQSLLKVPSQYRLGLLSTEGLTGTGVSASKLSHVTVSRRCLPCWLLARGLSSSPCGPVFSTTWQLASIRVRNTRDRERQKSQCLL